MNLTEPPRIGISRCLLGDEVRFDGGHKRDRFLTDTFARVVEWVPVCPELEVGMGVPREAIHLVDTADGAPSGSRRVTLLGVRTGTDWTDRMVRFSRARTTELASGRLSGFVLKKDSPSCGMERVRVKTLRMEPGAPSGGRPQVVQTQRSGRGLFAESLMIGIPDLPVEEEGRLQDPILRENFVERVFAFQRVRAFFSSRWSAGALVRFHTAHKLQLLAHARTGYARLGRLVADPTAHPRGELARAYQAEFMRTLTRPASPGRHADVMLHIAGHLKRLIDVGDRHELLACIEDHRQGLLPLIVPITLLRHHVRRHDVTYLRDQIYLDPHPRELALRNHV